ncbi:MAG TPA: tRNA lysidine(34) synthetase TilS [Pyrinomonadaceae bacterium]|jgi:tRNA(Ile)-lysidine synthase
MKTAEENPATHSAGRARLRLGRFALKLRAEWKRLGLPFGDAPVVVAVSGGADSTALLLALDELLRAGRLGTVALLAAHLDHGLRGAAACEDARWVAELSRELGFEIELGRAAVGELAARTGDNLEQTARRARYEFLSGVASRHGASVVLTAHTMEDQAETVLLRLMRGSGAEGLGGIEPLRALEAGGEVLLARPLLGWARRSGTERYCRERGVRFRADEMNDDEGFARVRVRKTLLPLMRTFNPRIVEALARSAGLLREDASALAAAASELLTAAREEGASGLSSVNVNVLAGAPAALRRRALRLWIAQERGSLRRLEAAHLLGVERLLEGERGGRVALLPGGSFIERRRGQLRFHLK